MRIWHAIFTWPPSGLRSIPHDRMFFGMHYKNCIKVQAFEFYLYYLYCNNLLTTGFHILSVKIMTKYNKKYILVLGFHILSVKIMTKYNKKDILALVISCFV